MVEESRARNPDGPASGTRRAFLQSVGAGATALTVGGGLVGSAAAEGIPTPWLHRDGNWIRDPSDNGVTLRGVNVVDPARAAAFEWRRPVPETVEHATNAERGWHSRVIRLPMQPADIAKDGQGNGARVDPVAFSKSKLETYLEKYVDPVVEKCREVGAYVILDYHRHKMQSLEYTNGSLHDEVTMFWETVAPRYAEDSHVLFEVYNEPISPFVGFRERGVDVALTDERSRETWDTWKDAAQPWVDTIREHAPRNIVLIGSPRWSQWTYWAPKNEFDGDNLAYTGHVYGHPNLRPLSKYFGTPAEEVPVFMTEFGYDAEADAEYIAGTSDVEGQQFRDFFESYENVSWQVWCFDHIWAPAMFDKPNTEPDWILLDGEYHGKFFKDYLAEKKDANLPGSGDGTGDATPPTSPGNLSVTATAAESLTVAWQAASDSGGSGLAEYVVTVADRETTVPADTTEATIAALSPDTSYEVSVAAVDGAGNRSEPATLTATTETGGESDVEPIDGTLPQDIDEDGQYRDLNANDGVDFDDVVIYFNHMSEPPMTDHVAAYDYNGNDEVDFADVVALFESL